MKRTVSLFKNCRMFSRLPTPRFDRGVRLATAGLNVTGLSTTAKEGFQSDAGFQTSSVPDGGWCGLQQTYLYYGEVKKNGGNGIWGKAVSCKKISTFTGTSTEGGDSAYVYKETNDQAYSGIPGAQKCDGDGLYYACGVDGRRRRASGTKRCATSRTCSTNGGLVGCACPNANAYNAQGPGWNDDFTGNQGGHLRFGLGPDMPPTASTTDPTENMPYWVGLYHHNKVAIQGPQGPSDIFQCGTASGAWDGSKGACPGFTETGSTGAYWKTENLPWGGNSWSIGVYGTAGENCRLFCPITAPSKML